MKKWLYGVSIAVAAGLIVSFILSKVQQVNFLGGISILIEYIKDFFLIEFPIYGFLLTIIIIVIAFLLYVKISDSGSLEPEWKKYLKRYYKGSWYKWRYVGNRIDSITPICGECLCILSRNDNPKKMWPNFKCPKCGIEYDVNLYNLEEIIHDLEKVIASDIESGDYKKHL